MSEVLIRGIFRDSTPSIEDEQQKKSRSHVLTHEVQVHSGLMIGMA